MAAAPPAPELPHPHDLWLQAGGGTDRYDPDRYVALLRDGGWAHPRASWTEIVRRALQLEPIEAERMAQALRVELGRHGYRIHDVARCVRPPDPGTLGRPMSRAEEAELLPR